MRILLTNDDGFGAPGIKALEEVLSSAHEVCVVAPAKNNSGASSKINMFSPLGLKKISDREFALDGSPVDCVISALEGGYIPWVPDVVISGINDGPNVGTDIVYSGTCGAARQGAFLGIPSIALSVDTYASGTRTETPFFETLASFALKNLDQLVFLCGEKNPSSGREFFVNVNAPAAPSYMGVKAAECCVKRYGDIVKIEKGPDGEYLSSLCAGGGRTPESMVEKDDLDDVIVASGCVAVSRICPEPCGKTIPQETVRKLVL